MYNLGFDIGGSSVKAVLVKNKEIIKSDVRDLPDNLEGLLNLIVEMKNNLSDGVSPEDIKGIGFGVAGVLNQVRDSILKSPNIQYLNNQPLKKLLEEKLPTYPIKLEHDVNCFLLAEREIGLAREIRNVFYMTLGTGIGTGFMVDGKIILGGHGAAGEGGHTIIDEGKGMKFDELEELAANKFILSQLGFGSIEAIKRAEAGDEKAKDVLFQLGRNLGVGIANIINTFDPEAIILSGGISEAKEFILPGIKNGVEKFVVSTEAKKAQILFSKLGRFGGALGAALMFG